MRINNESCIAMIHDLRTCSIWNSHYEQMTQEEKDECIKACEALMRVYEKLPKVFQSEGHAVDCKIIKA